MHSGMTIVNRSKESSVLRPFFKSLWLEQMYAASEISQPKSSVAGGPCLALSIPSIGTITLVGNRMSSTDGRA